MVLRVAPLDLVEVRLLLLLLPVVVAPVVLLQVGEVAEDVEGVQVHVEVGGGRCSGGGGRPRRRSRRRHDVVLDEIHRVEVDRVRVVRVGGGGVGLLVRQVVAVVGLA